VSFNNINIQGFGDQRANGLYELKGTNDNQPFYLKRENFGEETDNIHILIFNNKYESYSYTPSWYIIEVTMIKVGDSDPQGNLNSPVPIYTPKYRSLSTDLFNAEWLPLTEITSGELSLGGIFAIESSSSSSSSSSIDSSSSSSSKGISSSSSSSSDGYSESSSSLSVDPWTPKEISTAAWYDASDDGTITKDVSNFVSQVDDKSGNNRHIEQIVGSRQPLYVNGGADFNNENVLRFDGTDDFLEKNVTFTAKDFIAFVKWSDGGTINGQFSIISDGSDKLNIARDGILEQYKVFDANDFGHDDDKWFINGNPDNNPTTANPLYDTAHIVGQPYGGSATLGGTFSTFLVGKSAAFGGRFLLGDVAEIILFPNILTYSERTFAEGYLAWKYGIANALPLSHPFKGSPPLLSDDPNTPPTEVVDLDVQSMSVGQITEVGSPTFDELDAATNDGQWSGGDDIGDWYIRSDADPANIQAMEISTTDSGGETDSAALLSFEDRFFVCYNITVTFTTATKRSTGFTRRVRWQLMSGYVKVLELVLDNGILTANGVNTGFSVGAADTYKVDPWDSNAENAGQDLVWDVSIGIYANGSFDVDWNGTIYSAPEGSIDCTFVDGFQVNYNRTIGGHGVYLSSLEISQVLTDVSGDSSSSSSS